MILLFLSQFLMGIMYSVVVSVGITYMDDNVSKKSYPLFYSKLSHILYSVFGTHNLWLSVCQ